MTVKNLCISINFKYCDSVMKLLMSVISKWLLENIIVCNDMGE